VCWTVKGTYWWGSWAGGPEEPRRAHLLSSCRWPGTSGSGSTGSGSSASCPPCTLCCPGRCSSGLCAPSSWRSLYSPHSCRRRSAYLEGGTEAKRWVKSKDKLRGVATASMFNDLRASKNGTEGSWIVTRRSVSADGTEALLGKHRPRTPGRHLLQAQRGLHVIGAAHRVEPGHGHGGVDLEGKVNRTTAMRRSRLSLYWGKNVTQWFSTGGSRPTRFQWVAGLCLGK